MLLAVAVAGAGVLVAAEFTTLLAVRAGSVTVSTVRTGSHHSYAQIPVALFALVLVWTGVRSTSRAAFLAAGVLAIVALLIALVGDLPDTRSTGLTSTYALARASARVGLYLETLGAVLLLMAAGVGLLWPRAGAARPVDERPRRD